MTTLPTPEALRAEVRKVLFQWRRQDFQGETRYPLDEIMELVAHHTTQLVEAVEGMKDTRPFPGIDSPLPDGAIRETCYKQGRNEALTEVAVLLRGGK